MHTQIFGWRKWGKRRIRRCWSCGKPGPIAEAPKCIPVPEEETGNELSDKVRDYIRKNAERVHMDLEAEEAATIRDEIKELQHQLGDAEA